MGESLKVKVVSATPGADANTYNIFSSIVTFGTGTAGDTRNQGLRAHCISRVNFGVENSGAGTLKAYRSVDGGTNWDQIGGDIAVAAAPATDINGPYDYLVDTYDDFKIDWVNGGAAQDPWRPEVTLIRGDRASGT